jgi:hypothetical protein
MTEKIYLVTSSGIVGAMIGAAIAWLSCGTIFYLYDPNPEMIDPFYFPANVGAVFLGAPAGLIVGLVAGGIKATQRPESEAKQEPKP